jgi:large subunit ribosomal protein L13
MSQSLTRLTKTSPTKNLLSEWYLIDARGKILGRLASRTAKILIGKSKTTYSPGQDHGDHVVILNAKDVAVTGRKESKQYFRHSGYPGGVKITNLAKLRRDNPERIIQEAVSGMLPKSRLRSRMLKRLHISSGPEQNYSDKNLKEVKLG